MAIVVAARLPEVTADAMHRPLTAVAERLTAVAERLTAVTQHLPRPSVIADRLRPIAVAEQDPQARHPNWLPLTADVPPETAMVLAAQFSPKRADKSECGLAIAVLPVMKTAVHPIVAILPAFKLPAFKIADVRLDPARDHAVESVPGSKEKACSIAALPAPETAVNLVAIVARHKALAIAAVPNVLRPADKVA